MMLDVERAFCVPGESYLAILDEMYSVRDRFSLVSCRHESGAGFMAEAYGRLTGRPGICLVSRGPGAANAAGAVHMAAQAGTPMLLLIGQVPRALRGRDAFQEVELVEMFGHMVKWAAEVPAADRLPEFVARAFATSTAGRPGPVVLSLPEDILSDTTDARCVEGFVRHGSSPPSEDLYALRAMLEDASQPLVVVGGSGWTDGGVAAFRQFIEQFGLPVATSFRRQDLIDNDSEYYWGEVGIGSNPALLRRLNEADLVIAVGTALGDITSGGYTRFPFSERKQRLVHVQASAEQLGRLYRPDLAIESALSRFCLAAAELPPLAVKNWRNWAAEGRSDYEAWREVPDRDSVLDQDDYVSLGPVVAHLRDVLPSDAIVANGAGNYTGWLHRHFWFHEFGSQLAPPGGSMGYGLPAGLTAKALFPDRQVVVFAGDGCFLMSGQELATAVQYQLPVVVVVANNASYGTIRMHQERRYPGRSIGTQLRNPDFAALARSYGAYGEVVTTTKHFAAAFDRAVDSGLPAVLDLHTDPAQLTASVRI